MIDFPISASTEISASSDCSIQPITSALEIDITGKNVLIIGCPASGKSYLGMLLAGMNPGHDLIHTDDYMPLGYEPALYAILEHLQARDGSKPTIIEGVQGYRLLRKGVQLDSYYPDIVIELSISEDLMHRTYIRERNEKKRQYLKGFNGMHRKILNDYRALPNAKPPIWYEVKNHY